jgi:hypothetical protein
MTFVAFQIIVMYVIVIAFFTLTLFGYSGGGNLLLHETFAVFAMVLVTLKGKN